MGNTPLYIAKRYFFSKKKQNIIHVISLISLIGISIATTSLITVLSVLNGFEKITLSLFSAFDAEILIEAKEGKTFHLNDIPLDKIKSTKGVCYVIPCVQENALISYKHNQQIVTIKGTTNEYSRMTNFNQYLVDGEFLLQNETENYILLGAEIDYLLGIQHQDIYTPVKVNIPKREKNLGVNPQEAFNTGNLIPAGVFQVSADIDNRFVITSIGFMREMMDYAPDEVTSIELGFYKNANVKITQAQLQEILGKNYTVKNRYQQQELYYQTANLERMVIYIIMSFIVFIATFNIVGSLSLLMLDKSKDIRILQSMGANKSFITKVFFYEGFLISLFGATIGLILGGLICWLQQTFELIRINGNNFVVKAFPVDIHWQDFFWVFLLVCFIGALSVYLTVRTKMRKEKK